MSDEQKSAIDLASEAAEAKAREANASRTGVSTRIAVGKTRGKNPQVISYEHFDESIPDSLPKSMNDFVTFTKADEKTLLDYCIRGYNDASYEAASDPLKEFVNPSWPDDAQTQFRLVVRNYARGANVSLEDAVNLIKPGFEATFSKK